MSIDSNCRLFDKLQHTGISEFLGLSAETWKQIQAPKPRGHKNRAHPTRFDKVFTPVMPRRAPQLLARSARRGAAGMPLVFGGAGAPSENPRQKRGAQETRGIRVSFLLDTFLWTSKEKYRGCRSANRRLN